MKQKNKIILFSILLGCVLWMVDATIDYFMFFEKSFLEILFFDMTMHELYMRFFASVSITIFGFVISKYIEKIKEKDELIDDIFVNVIPLCVTSNDHEMILANKQYYSTFGTPDEHKKSVKCYESRPGPECHTENCPIKQIKDGSGKYLFESNKQDGNGSKKDFIVTATPWRNSSGEQIGIIESFQDITFRKQLENEKEQLITELKESLEKVKLLSGFIPICASCKKIRDDKGFWNQVEAYITKHSEAKFSHGICPECAKKLYPEFVQESPDK